MDEFRARVSRKTTSLVEEALVLALAAIGTALTVGAGIARRFSRRRN